jgi:hypothetical protein
MFAVILKNSILMMLIIFIIHFMILNYINDFKNENESRYFLKNKYLNDTLINKNKVSTFEEISTTFSTLDAEKEKEDHTIMDLYNFVYDDKTTDDNLNVFFPDINTNTNTNTNQDSIEKSCSVTCVDQPDDSKKDFCTNEVDQFFKDKKKNIVNNNTKNDISSNNTNSTNQGNHPILFEYEHDDTNQLIGYETYESSYMVI